SLQVTTQFRFLLVHVAADCAASERAHARADQSIGTVRIAPDKQTDACTSQGADSCAACRVRYALFAGIWIGGAAREHSRRQRSNHHILDHGNPHSVVRRPSRRSISPSISLDYGEIQFGASNPGHFPASLGCREAWTINPMIGALL